MSDLSRNRPLDVALGTIGVAPHEFPPLPDDVMTNPLAGRLDARAWFAHPERPFEIEIGTGKGHFIVHEAKARPGTNFLGIEWEGEIYAYCADRCRRHQLANVRMLHANAADFLRWRTPDATVGVVHLYYSDPWPKTKHHKNRVVQDRFLAEVWRVLVPRGELRVVTDHDELWAWDVEHFARVCDPARAGGPLFEMVPFTPPDWVGQGETVGTNYERKMCGDKEPHSAVLRKVGL